VIVPYIQALLLAESWHVAAFVYVIFVPVAGYWSIYVMHIIIKLWCFNCDQSRCS